MLIKKLLSVLGVLTICTIFSGVVFAADDAGGVGILGAAQQTGQDVKCPDGVPNCEPYQGAFDDAIKQEAKRYSTSGTQLFLLQLVGGLLTFAAVAAVIMLISSAVPLVMAGGNQEKVQAAHKSIRWVLTGLAIIMLALFIVRNMTELVYRSIVGPAGSGATTEASGTPAPTNALKTDTTTDTGSAANLGVGGSGQSSPLLDSLTPGASASLFCQDASEIPAACYYNDDLDLNLPQKAVDNVQKCQADALAGLQDLCADLSLTGDGCTIIGIQGSLQGLNFYASLPAACVKEPVDNLYGLCTVQAIKNYCQDDSQKVAAAKITTDAQRGISNYNLKELKIAAGAPGGVVLKSAVKDGTIVKVTCEYQGATITASLPTEDTALIGEDCARKAYEQSKGTDPNIQKNIQLGIDNFNTSLELPNGLGVTIESLKPNGAAYDLVCKYGTNEQDYTVTKTVLASAKPEDLQKVGYNCASEVCDKGNCEGGNAGS